MDFACDHRAKNENQLGIPLLNENSHIAFEFLLQHRFAFSGRGRIVFPPICCFRLDLAVHRSVSVLHTTYTLYLSAIVIHFGSSDKWIDRYWVLDIWHSALTAQNAKYPIPNT